MATNQVCNIAEEIRSPVRTVPRSLVSSIIVVAAIYIIMSIVIIGLIPWPEAMETRTIASVFIARTFSDPEQGRIAGTIMTSLILFVAASSLFAFMLGYSRIPFAAARKGQLFRAFARVHRTKHFPHISLLTLGFISIPFCFFTLGQLVSWLIQVQILVRFIWQCAGVILLHEYRKDIPRPFKMWLYPLPALLSLGLWLTIFVTGPWEGINFSVLFLGAAIAAYFIFEKMHGRPPLGEIDEASSQTG